MRQKRRPHKRLLIFVPEGKRRVSTLPIDLHDRWVGMMLHLLSVLFGGATAYGRGVGAWKEPRALGARIHFDRVTVIESWIDPGTRNLKGAHDQVVQVLREMCRDLHEQVVASMMDGVFQFVRSR